MFWQKTIAALQNDIKVLKEQQAKAADEIRESHQREAELLYWQTNPPKYSIYARLPEGWQITQVILFYPHISKFQAGIIRDLSVAILSLLSRNSKHKESIKTFIKKSEQIYNELPTYFYRLIKTNTPGNSVPTEKEERKKLTESELDEFIKILNTAE